MRIIDKRGDQSNSTTNPIPGTTNPVPGTVIFYNNNYLLITDDPDIYVDLSTGDLLESPIEIFDYQILNNVKLVVEWNVNYLFFFYVERSKRYEFVGSCTSDKLEEFSKEADELNNLMYGGGQKVVRVHTYLNSLAISLKTF